MLLEIHILLVFSNRYSHFFQRDYAYVKKEQGLGLDSAIQEWQWETFI